MRRGRELVAALVAGAVLFGLAVPAAHAEDGYAGFDAAYAGDGTLDLTASDSPTAIDAQDRLLVLASTGAPGARLSRYLPSGAPDPAFAPLDLPQTWAHQSDVRVLDGGTISIAQEPSSPNIDRTVWRVTPSGSLDASFATSGSLSLADIDHDDPFLEFDDGTLVAGTRLWGAVRVRSYDATGHLDPAFSGDGVAEVACCGPDPQTPRIVALQPDGDDGDLLALVADRDQQALYRLAPDGSAAAVTMPVSGWVTALWAVPVGGFFVATQNGPADAAGAQSVHLGDDLVADGGDAAAPWPASGAGEVHVAGSRAIVWNRSGSGTATLTAFTAAGVDRAFGTNGSISTEAMAPENNDVTSLSSGLAVAVAADGRILVAGSWEWGPGFIYPYYQSAQRIETYASDGRRLHRWDSRGTPDRMWGAEAEQDGSGFLLASTQTNVPLPLSTSVSKPRVRRLVPPSESAALGPVLDAAFTLAGDVATVTWKAPAASPGLLITGYQVTYAVAGEAPVTKDVDGTSTVLGLQSRPPLTVHRIEIRPKGLGGALGPVTTLLVVPGLPVDAFLAQVADGFGGDASATARDEAKALLGDGSATPSFLVRAAAQGPEWSSAVDPVTRLYLAYFQRSPDPAGLRYWTAKRRTGTSVARISAVFADSSEFRRTYGSLSNRKFVELVYTNVLGRNGDPGGLTYWTGRLDRRATSRGHLMASFSESSEHVRRTRATVDTVSIHWGLLGRTPTAGELVTWAGPSPAGDADAMVRSILQGAEYRARLD